MHRRDIPRDAFKTNTQPSPNMPASEANYVCRFFTGWLRWETSRTKKKLRRVRTGKWSLLYECILEGKTISKKRVGTIIRIVSFGDIFERNYRGIRFAVECIYWKEEEEEDSIRLGGKIRWTKWRKGERKEEKKRKKGRVPGINKSVKFYIIKDFMDCD